MIAMVGGLAVFVVVVVEAYEDKQCAMQGKKGISIHRHPTPNLPSTSKQD
jgi:hypothetical protein